MNETNLVGIHETRVAHHVAAVGQVDGQDCAASVLYRAGAMVVQLFIVMGADVASGEDLFEMLEEFHVYGHYVFKVAMDGTVFHHQDLAVALDDLGLDLAHFFVHQYLMRMLAVDDLLPDFMDAFWTKRVGTARPAEWRLGLFPGFQKRLFSPFRRK